MFCGNVKDDTIIKDINIPKTYIDDKYKITTTKARVRLS